MSLTASDFSLAPYSIPNTGQTLVSEPLNLYIAEKQSDILTKLIGRPLYKDYLAGLESVGGDWLEITVFGLGALCNYNYSVWESLVADNEGNTPEEGVNWTLVDENNKWLILRDGYEYEYINETYYWVGFDVLLKPYIYSEWLKDNFDSFSGVGIVVSNSENSNVVSPSNRICDSFNDFSKKAGICERYSINQKDTLYGFLVANEEDYTNQRFQEQGLKNIFNI